MCPRKLHSPLGFSTRSIRFRSTQPRRRCASALGGRGVALEHAHEQRLQFRLRPRAEEAQARQGQEADTRLQDEPLLVHGVRDHQGDHARQEQALQQAEREGCRPSKCLAHSNRVFREGALASAVELLDARGDGEDLAVSLAAASSLEGVLKPCSVAVLSLAELKRAIVSALVSMRCSKHSVPPFLHKKVLYINLFPDRSQIRGSRRNDVRF